MAGQYSIENEIGELLETNGMTLSLAESATGGMVSARIVNVAGSAAYFKGGVVAYDNAVKEGVLGVTHDTLSSHGAVSEETAREMAAGVRRITGTDIGLSDTGIAGPSGGTAVKPVGLFYIGLVTPRDTIIQEHFFSGTRNQIREQATEKVLLILRNYLRGQASHAS